MRRKIPPAENTTQSVAPLLTVEDVAAILQLSRVKVYDLINKNGLPTVKISGARRIQPTALQTWIEQHQQ
jgi:excisionase family DNA binding protein